MKKINKVNRPAPEAGHAAWKKETECRGDSTEDLSEEKGPKKVMKTSLKKKVLAGKT